MPLGRHNTRTFHRTLYGPGINERVRLLKRQDNQRQGTVTAYVLYDCWLDRETKNQETIQGEMSANHRATWHIPFVELERNGIHHLNPLDRIERIEGPNAGQVWEPESTTDITEILLNNHINVDCLRVDPPRSG